MIGTLGRLLRLVLGVPSPTLVMLSRVNAPDFLTRGGWMRRQEAALALRWAKKNPWPSIPINRDAGLSNAPLTVKARLRRRRKQAARAPERTPK